MQTSRPFSTISYNTKPFLKSKLDELVRFQVLDFYAFIEHSAEDDESKSHIHLYVIPSTKMNTNSLKDMLAEVDPTFPDKPLTCTICKSSKWDDFYLYGIHDKAYLASKGQSRKYHYVLDDFVTSDEDYLREIVRCIDRSKYVGMERIIDSVDNHVTFAEMVRLGQIPIQLINQYKYAYDCLVSMKVQRGGRQSHTPKVVMEDCFDSAQGDYDVDYDEVDYEEID